MAGRHLLSAVPVVKEKVYALLTTALDVPVVWGLSDRHREFVSIWQGETTREHRILAANAPLDESFEITLVIQSALPSGKDMKAAEDRSWELLDAVEAVLRADLTLDGTTFFTTPAKAKQEFIQTEKLQGSRITLTFSGTARI